MPTGYYSGQGKHFNKKLGRWETVKKESAFDYDGLDDEACKKWGLLMSFFRFYPDYFLDLIKDDNAPYDLELPQRLILRIQARYQTTYVTGARGITKTFCTISSKEIDGVLYPREKVRYFAPSQKQSAKLAADAFDALETCYPLLSSWWSVNNKRDDMFKITTPFGSEITMYAPRGDNFHSLIGEEMAQEGDGGFDFERFEDDVKKGHRLIRNVDGQPDRTRVQLKQNFISNASSRNNKAFYIYRRAALNTMIRGDKYDGFCLDMPWQIALICNLRDVAYYKKEKATSPKESWQREMECLYVGTDDNPLIDEATLSKCKKLLVMEDRHCNDENAIYIVSHDVAYTDSRKNAKCADVVLKLTRFKSIAKQDKYRKQVVYVNIYPPIKDQQTQTRTVKNFWSKYCIENGETTYLCVDSMAGGDFVTVGLHNPLNDGLRPLKTMDSDIIYRDLEQKDALPVLYAMKANGLGGKNSEGEMITYAQNEFEAGNVELLVSNALDGVESYKKYHGIKDDSADGKIAIPYKNTEILCKQIANLRTKVSGVSLKEERKSQGIQRDAWSALKYGLWVAKKLEDKLNRENHKTKSSWSEVIDNFKNGNLPANNMGNNNVRSRLLGLRKR